MTVPMLNNEAMTAPATYGFCAIPAASCTGTRLRISPPGLGRGRSGSSSGSSSSSGSGKVSVGVGDGVSVRLEVRLSGGSEMEVSLDELELGELDGSSDVTVVSVVDILVGVVSVVLDDSVVNVDVAVSDVVAVVSVIIVVAVVVPWGSSRSLFGQSTAGRFPRIACPSSVLTGTGTPPHVSWISACKLAIPRRHAAEQVEPGKKSLARHPSNGVLYASRHRRGMPDSSKSAKFCR